MYLYFVSSILLSQVLPDCFSVLYPLNPAFSLLWLRSNMSYLYRYNAIATPVDVPAEVVDAICVQITEVCYKYLLYFTFPFPIGASLSVPLQLHRRKHASSRSSRYGILDV